MSGKSSMKKIGILLVIIANIVLAVALVSSVKNAIGEIQIGRHIESDTSETGEMSNEDVDVDEYNEEEPDTEYEESKINNVTTKNNNINITNTRVTNEIVNNTVDQSKNEVTNKISNTTSNTINNTIKNRVKDENVEDKQNESEMFQDGSEETEDNKITLKQIIEELGNQDITIVQVALISVGIALFITGIILIAVVKNMK